ncbi:MAG: LptF/LptG family permease [Bacteroidia bacterium]|nr:LptF/LptG family permease [Bacteroidia bacterium]
MAISRIFNHSTVILKRLHNLLIRSFLPPFFITLFTSVFLFFLVQIVITYLDDLIGKGLRSMDLIKLFTYAWIAIIPQCIPLAVLLASIMCFGQLAENYELAAMKSSGLSLFKIMRPLIVLILILAGLTFLFNNFVLPYVHLKSTTLLYDIRQKKPTVNIKEGVFYNGIENFSLRVGKKSANKDSLKDIYIYNHTARMGNTTQLYANSGRITITSDTSEMILLLRDGNRYEETNDPYGNRVGKTLTQLNFKNLQVNIPLEDFKLKHTNEELFKGNEEMLNIWQLDSVADSTARIIHRRVSGLQQQAATYFYSRTSAAMSNTNSTHPLVKVQDFCKTLSPEQYNSLLQNALNTSRIALGNIDSSEHGIVNEQDNVLRYEIEWHKKMVVSFACIVLFFIGAPLGAIIRKGGLGLPVVSSVIFFLAYYILTELFLNLAIEGRMQPWKALWSPPLIFLPLSAFLTYKAARDSVMFDLTIYTEWLKTRFKRKTLA